MKKIISILIILIIFTFMLCSCTPEDRDLQDGICNTCGGNWHYEATYNVLSTRYIYKCDYCGKEILTYKWWGKL